MKENIKNYKVSISKISKLCHINGIEYFNFNVKINNEEFRLTDSKRELERLKVKIKQNY